MNNRKYTSRVTGCVIKMMIIKNSNFSVEIFKNNTTFLIIFTNMFRRYIRHSQCDGYESLQ